MTGTIKSTYVGKCTSTPLNNMSSESVFSYTSADVNLGLLWKVAHKVKATWMEHVSFFVEFPARAAVKDTPLRLALVDSSTLISVNDAPGSVGGIYCKRIT